MSRGGRMFQSLLTFISDNPLIFLVCIAVIVFLSVLKQVIKWLLILLVLGVFIVYGVNYTPEGEVSLKEQILEQIEAKDYEAVSRFLDGDSSVSITSLGNGNFVASTEGVQVRGSFNSDTVTFTYRGQQHIIKLSPELKEYLQKLYEK